MKLSSLVTATSASLAAGSLLPRLPNGGDKNPFLGRTHYVNPTYAEKLNTTLQAFVAQNDTLNAARTRSALNIGTFVWVSKMADLPNIDAAITGARAAKEATGEEQIVGLVLYDLPNRDCSAGESAGEFILDEDGLNRYKTEFVDPYAEAVGGAEDARFAIVLEPDSLGNAVTNMGIELCNVSIPAYKEGIAYAIEKLQFDHVSLYIDAAHGGWLGWDDNLEPTAAVMAEVVELAGPGAKIRGFSINVSNYNPYNAVVREPYTEWSNSWDESHYATSLSPHLEEKGLPAHFIVDQGRVALPGARAEWGDWCNVNPSGFGMRPTIDTNNPNVDSIVWIKPGGEADGACGMEGAPAAGEWFDEFAQMLVKNAQPCLEPIWPKGPLDEPEPTETATATPSNTATATRKPTRTASPRPTRTSRPGRP
ncbi:1,4-beta-D-glucan cellobiohydrolase cel6b [Onygenales sp. PD_40]|nr:1,4-beta-D-glucan cellobiohydrolase cel6b [Onygenales sp. PD_40]